MRKLVSFMHISLDGMVCGPKGEMNWIKVDEEIFDYAGKRTDEANAALYGRVTYDMMEAYWPTAADKPNASAHDKKHSAWYLSVPKTVLSKTLQKARDNVTIIRDNLKEEIDTLKRMEGKEIIIFGSPSAVDSLRAYGLIDEYWLFVNPIILGNGRPMFKSMKEQVPLRLLHSHVFSNGVVCLHYAVNR
jgi:dihydrofolate reductase